MSEKNKELYRCRNKRLNNARIDQHDNNTTFSSGIDNVEDQELCVICHGAYTEGDRIAFSKNSNCSHAFHVHCISNWLMESNSCPVCREDYLLPGTNKSS